MDVEINNFKFYCMSIVENLLNPKLCRSILGANKQA